MHNEEQASRDRSEVLAYQRPDVMDPLKALVRRQISDDLDKSAASAKERGCL